MKILITGASGYLAGFVLRLLQPHCELSLFDRAAPPAEFATLPFIKGDITSYDDVFAACAGHDAVVHLVALVRDRFGQPLAPFCDVMVKGTWNVAEACSRQGVKRLVNISSVIVDGWPPENARPHRVGAAPNFTENDLFYSLAKTLGETIVDAYGQAHGLSVVNLRPGAIEGDGFNTPPARPAEGPAHWFFHVDPRDVAAATLLAVQSDVRGTYYVVAARHDSMWEWQTAADALGFTAQYNWPQIEDS